jgi:hypothetical protein
MSGSSCHEVPTVSSLGPLRNDGFGSFPWNFHAAVLRTSPPSGTMKASTRRPSGQIARRDRVRPASRYCATECHSGGYVPWNPPPLPYIACCATSRCRLNQPKAMRMGSRFTLNAMSRAWPGRGMMPKWHLIGGCEALCAPARAAMRRMPASILRGVLRRPRATHAPPQRPTGGLPEVKSHSSIDRFLVVFHSPTGMAETGLLACR